MIWLFNGKLGLGREMKYSESKKSLVTKDDEFNQELSLLSQMGLLNLTNNNSSEFLGSHTMNLML